MRSFELTGTSMWPYLRDGDRALVTESPLRPAVGSLVVIDDHVVHRLIGPGQTKGDRFATVDPPGEHSYVFVDRILLKGMKHAVRPQQDAAARRQATLSRLHGTTRPRFIKFALLLLLIAHGYWMRRKLMREAQRSR